MGGGYFHLSLRYRTPGEELVWVGSESIPFWTSSIKGPLKPLREDINKYGGKEPKGAAHMLLHRQLWHRLAPQKILAGGFFWV